MAFLGGVFDLPDGARLTGISDLEPERGALRSGLVTAHRVTVPLVQRAATEVGFTGAHLPLAVAGFTGNNPDGSEWFVTFQALDPDAARARCAARSRTRPASSPRVWNAPWGSIRPRPSVRCSACPSRACAASTSVVASPPVSSRPGLRGN